MLRKTIFFSLLLAALSTHAQLRLDTLGWRSPVDIPIYLSGNFAELRSDHFHSGIDIKTQGEEGHKIYAVQDGYVARVKVSPTGYGNAIYIIHPDGYTSVYAHLSEFGIQLERYVRSAQYNKESFAVNLFPKPGEIVVKKGEIIALSGNSGSSAGPHLHFEVRDTRSAHPLNGLFLGLPITDNIAPKMYQLYAYPYGKEGAVEGSRDKQIYTLRKSTEGYKIAQGDTLRAYGTLGLGLKVNDYLNGSSNRCGVHSIKMYVNDTLYFHSQFDEFSFAETRYINSLMDYAENETIRRKLHRLYVEPNNKLSVYHQATNKGLLTVKEGQVQQIDIVTDDVAGNRSQLRFYIMQGMPALPQAFQEGYRLAYKQSFTLDTLGLSIKLAANSLYDDYSMPVRVDTVADSQTFAFKYTLGEPTIAVHKYYNLSFDVDSMADSLYSKLVAVKYKKGKPYAIGGEWDEGRMQVRLREFGTFSVMLDTLAPVVVPLGDLSKTNAITDEERIAFRIYDDFSGVSSYRGTINGQWVLFQYDPKNKYLFYQFDEYFPAEGEALLELTVTDGGGNETLYRQTLEVNPVMDNYIGQ